MAAPTTTERYVAAFEAFASNGAAGAPEWLRELRSRGIGRFAEVGFPTTREENWRFTSVKDIAQRTFKLATATSIPGPVSETLSPYTVPDAIRVVLVNGRWVNDLAQLDDLPDGLRVESLAAAVAGGDHVVAQHLGQYASLEDNCFAALNTAFTDDGAFVYVPRGVVAERPIQIIYLSTSPDGQLMTHPRNLVVVDEGANARVIETYMGTTDDVYFTNAVSEIVVGDNAHVECYRIQRESQSAYHVATTHSVQGRHSRYALHAVPFGSAIARHDIRMVMNGEGGEGVLNGLYVVGGSQHVDHNTVIDHAVPHCESHEYFNGILDDRAHAVFNGRIIVRPGAQKTDSKQTNNNLLLSENARADSQPQLEIYADDVKCTHGATMGPMDDNALFYLESRGLDPTSARNMLTYGFGVEILDRMQAQAVRDYLEALVKDRLDQAARKRQVA